MRGGSEDRQNTIKENNIHIGVKEEEGK